MHQYCFYPRALLTPSDAMFVAKFIRLAHDLGTIGFSTVYAYNNVSFVSVSLPLMGVVLPLPPLSGEVTSPSSYSRHHIYPHISQPILSPPFIRPRRLRIRQYLSIGLHSFPRPRGHNRLSCRDVGCELTISSSTTNSQRVSSPARRAKPAILAGVSEPFSPTWTPGTPMRRGTREKLLG